jgi:hypothetical protein
MAKQRKSSRRTSTLRKGKRSIRGGALTPQQVAGLSPEVIANLDARFVADKTTLTMTVNPPPSIKNPTVAWKSVGTYRMSRHSEQCPYDFPKNAGNTAGGEIIIGNPTAWAQFAQATSSNSYILVSKKNVAGQDTLAQMGGLTPGKNKWAFKLENDNKSVVLAWKVDTVTDEPAAVRCAVFGPGFLNVKTNVGTSTDRKSMFFTDRTKITAPFLPENTASAGPKKSEVYTLFVTPINDSDVVPEQASYVPAYVVYRPQ